MTAPPSPAQRAVLCATVFYRRDTADAVPQGDGPGMWQPQ